ncbi:TadE/TadG family type IV pilus assembly protein [Aureimonas sp. AU22]|uniref:TadE/TadG family type IV pilus assembly protein n=1 Tax=Aureimonas sp. AU22 TaxID=1638162 RepID=UPI0007860FC8|nr:TadE/TadG family type IV pilus assembly protein [Aureimonas sp. AU22]
MLQRLIKQFFGASGGSIPLMTALLMIPMTLMAGGAVDFVRYERLRVSLQDTLDRGVLAAASLTQSQDPEKLIKSYLAQLPTDLTYNLQLQESKGTNFRKIVATVSLRQPTTFLKLASVSELPISAQSTAQDERKNIEISLVLDISGSMVDNTGMTQLRPAAVSFIDALIRPDTKDFTSMSIIPFAGGTNIGPKVFDYLAGPLYKRRHLVSSCFETNTLEFSTGLQAFPLSDQFPDFTYYNWGKTDRKAAWCPRDDQQVTYITNDVALLKARANALQPYDGTGTAYAIKWGTQFLDPAMQPMMSALRKNGSLPIPAAFDGRPASYTDTGTRKILVLFTDGAVGFQPRPAKTTDNVVTGNISCTNCSRQIYSASEAVSAYKAACTYAKSKKITIFTIAFRVSAGDAPSLAFCASDPSYAYNIDGLNIATTFQSIATTIQKIRLVP